MKTLLRFLATFSFALSLQSSLSAAEQAGVVYDDFDGPGKGKHIVFISGDEEYRSEEALPQLAKILAKHHGFKCTVLFAIDPQDGTINPNISNIPGLEALQTADLMFIFTRFRDLPDEQMAHIVEYLDTGKPVVGIRTATHAFAIKPGKKYSKFSWNNNDKSYEQGFGRQVLGETWINHHGKHGSQSTRGIIAPQAKNHPIVRGIEDGDIWGPTDVYGVRLPLPGDSQPIVLGQVLTGMKKNDPPVEGKQNDPLMPIAWTKTYKSESGKTGRVFTSTIGASTDLAAAGTRRLLVNGVYWTLGMEDQIPEKSNVAIVGEFNPSPFKHNGFKAGMKPEDHKLN